MKAIVRTMHSTCTLQFEIFTLMVKGVQIGKRHSMHMPKADL